jgi:hypothetical protein
VANDPVGSIKDEEFLDWLSDDKYHEEDYALCN